MNDQRTEEMIENIEPTAECWEIVVPNDEANTEESANTDESAEDGACDKITEEDIEELRLKKLSLQEEIAMLEGEIEKKREESERRAREYLEFKELFGDVDPSELASEVISMVESGVPREIVDSMRDTVDCNIYCFGKTVPISLMFLGLIACVFILIGVYVLLVKRQNKNHR